jgi:hypothetical protein
LNPPARPQAQLPRPAPPPAPPASASSSALKPGKRRKGGILFFAHAGVANPELWRTWRGEEFKDSIVFFVFCPNTRTAHYKDAFQDAFNNEFNLGLKRVYTKWGDRSLVTVAVTSFVECFSRDPDIEVVYMVCGTSVPLQNPSFLFQESTCRTGETFQPFTSTMQPAPFDPCDPDPTAGFTVEGRNYRFTSAPVCGPQA